MEAVRGPGRGSYIWGRSVHNTRIERLWYDVTRGYGIKWKNLFIDLELYYGLDPENPYHIWLLHLLFVDTINSDAQEWADTWNSHTIELDGQRNRSPRDMFFFGLVEDGARGLEWVARPADEEIPEDELVGYGVDWEALENTRLMEHLLTNNPNEWEEHNPFAPINQPEKLSHVECEPPESPFDDEATMHIKCLVDERVPGPWRNMDVCKLVWQHAMDVVQTLYQADR
ncbi:hypothetical protein NEOLEDRAFT_1157389 [Neolentinus lepideus HHB14362 ss-1]|uniref:Integrase core domain-containing protein n=1 Tax=Neolentinus lepideus HHB14362 ss-1 TaxID=1314782 RepID=A0A165R1Z9_9AGAM|nr:hypothetical protein NEOLEDRAFT_1157389 [Neolentinus lepideus HHB14362 ss-1]